MKFSIFNLQFTKKKNWKPKGNSLSGFTIIELLVAMAIFVSVIGIVVGIFVGALRAERGLVNFMAVNDNVSLALEQMAREFRTGKDFAIIDSVGSAIAFTAGSEKAAYLLSDKTIMRGVCVSASCDTVSDFPDPVAITGNRVVIDRLLFDIFPTPPSPNWLPRITIRVGVISADADASSARTDIQTTVSARAQEP